MPSQRGTFILLSLILAGPAACRTAPREASIRPGINEGYFKQKKIAAHRGISHVIPAGLSQRREGAAPRD